jgi:L-gulonate 3-dehydrogenase
VKRSEGLKTACIGCGVIGASWAAAFVKAGHTVRLFDPAQSALNQALAEINVVIKGATGGDAKPGQGTAIGRVFVAASIEEAVRDADYVQESIVEDVDVKRRLFKQLDEFAPSSAVLASSTSEIQPSRFLEDLAGRDRCLVAHPISPPHLIPLVELCGSPWTTGMVIERAAAFLRGIGSEPIILRREIPGFILNRLQMALIREAMGLIDTGICSAADVDKVVRLGLGRRWAILGPFEAGHLNSRLGYSDYIMKFRDSMSSLFRALSVQNDIDLRLINRIDQELRLRVPLSKISEQQTQRDIRLSKLGEHLSTSIAVDHRDEAT